MRQKGLSNDAARTHSLPRAPRCKPDYDTEARDLCRVKISNFGHIDPAHQELTLMDYRTQVAAIVAHSDANAQEVQKALAQHRRSAPTSWKQSTISGILPHVKIPWLDALAEKAGGTNYKLEGYPSENSPGSPQQSAQTALAQAAGNEPPKLRGQTLDRNVILLPDDAVATRTLLIVGASKKGDRTVPGQSRMSRGYRGLSVREGKQRLEDYLHELPGAVDMIGAPYDGSEFLFGRVARFGDILPAEQRDAQFA